MGVNSCLLHRLLWGLSERMPGGYNIWVISGVTKSPNNQLVKCELFPSPPALVSRAPLKSRFTNGLFTMFKACVHRLWAATKALLILSIRGTARTGTISIPFCGKMLTVQDLLMQGPTLFYGKHQSGIIDSDDRDSLTGTKPSWFSGPGHIHFTNWRKLLHGDIYYVLLNDLLPRGIKNVRIWERKTFYNIWCFCLFLDPRILQTLLWDRICSTW